MGKVEKVVVLSVLFLIAVILVVSLTMDDPLNKEKVSIAGSPGTRTAVVPQPDKAPGEAAPSGAAGMVPLQPADSAIAQNTSGKQTSAATPPAGAGKPVAATPSALLSTNVQTAPVTTVPGEVHPAIPAGSILKTTEGLVDSYLPDMKFYTWQAGDSLRSIATKYYGDATKLTILRRNNEGRQDVQPGEKILIPVFDVDSPIAASAGADRDAVASAKPAAAPSAKGASAKDAGGPRTHTVKDGESLWKIAKQELGSGARWKEIYEANRDVLSTPDAVHTGLKLRIP